VKERTCEAPVSAAFTAFLLRPLVLGSTTEHGQCVSDTAV
jgi:hypothetical protein